MGGLQGFQSFTATRPKLETERRSSFYFLHPDPGHLNHSFHLIRHERLTKPNVEPSPLHPHLGHFVPVRPLKPLKGPLFHRYRACSSMTSLGLITRGRNTLPIFWKKISHQCCLLWWFHDLFCQSLKLVLYALDLYERVQVGFHQICGQFSATT